MLMRYAASNIRGILKIFKQLIQLGNDPKHIDSEGKSVIIHAATNVNLSAEILNFLTDSEICGTFEI
jgi:ankyrin repeat protein